MPGQEQIELGVLHDLVPVVEDNLNRHLAGAENWNPHDYVPWSEGRNFAHLGGEDYSPEQSRLSPDAKLAMVLNLLTEDNLPSYHHIILEQFGRDGAWGQWVGRWTAEEGRHAMAMRDYLVATRGVDPVELEQLRMDHMTRGYDAGDKGVLRTLAYVSFQELATRVSHRNTGKACGDPIADQLLTRIAKDENLHMVFYRNLGAAALDAAPDAMMQAIATEVASFQMPGSDLPDFGRRAARIANAGIYTPTQHLREVLAPVLRHWGVFERTDLSAEGEQAREALDATLKKLTAVSGRFEERQTRQQAAEAARAE
ncbi:MAG TPA: acyl-ACP desaturase [Candidatus Saccharimonadales bacterium]|jgi:acyl-[acyl-carrier-protein] desaturase|nr:acyl-ACP desaturase [Candidatus Saccharimonadales bacterium]